MEGHHNKKVIKRERCRIKHFAPKYIIWIISTKNKNIVRLSALKLKLCFWHNI